MYNIKFRCQLIAMNIGIKSIPKKNYFATHLRKLNLNNHILPKNFLLYNVNNKK